MTTKNLGEKIIKLRKLAKITQTELCKLSGVQQNTVCLIEKNKRSPTVKTLVKIFTAIKKELPEYEDILLSFSEK